MAPPVDPRQRRPTGRQLTSRHRAAGCAVQFNRSSPSLLWLVLARCGWSPTAASVNLANVGRIVPRCVDFLELQEAV